MKPRGQEIVVCYVDSCIAYNIVEGMLLESVVLKREQPVSCLSTHPHTFDDLGFVTCVHNMVKGMLLESVVRKREQPVSDSFTHCHTS